MWHTLIPSEVSIHLISTYTKNQFMETKYKILIGVLIVIGTLLVINEFVLFPIFPSRVSSASCALTQLSELTDRSKLIITGVAGESEWVTREIEVGEAAPPPGEKSIETGKRKIKQIFTDTTIDIDTVIKGNYNKEKIFATQLGGCNVRLNYCSTTSVFSEFVKGKEYLLFLSNQYEEDIYGFSGCGGKYEIRTDSSGEEIVDCYLPDIENCIEKEIKCPEQEGISDGVSEEGAESKRVPCIERYVLLDELIKQIQG